MRNCVGLTVFAARHVVRMRGSGTRLDGVSVKAEPDASLRASNSYLFAPVPEGRDTTPLPGFASEIAHSSMGRYWRTLSHLRTSQLFYLIRHRVFSSNNLARWRSADVYLRCCEVPARMYEWQRDVARNIIELGDLQYARTKPEPLAKVSWWKSEVARRELFHANYCDFLNVNLSAPGDAQLLRKATRIALSWCDQNPVGTEMGWHPFFLSLRIVKLVKISGPER